jgi:hypothetical protein
MKLLKSAAAMLSLLVALAIVAVVPAAANQGETAEADIAITPRAGDTFFTNAFKNANWGVETAIIPAGPFPEVPTITPMKVADLGFPPSNVLNFNPKASMPVCPDNQLGPPPTSNSVPVPTMLARCPDSLLGNGTAVFALAQSTSPVATRDGEILIFNGGRVGGLPKIKVYAYSYDTQVGIYTSAILQPSGQLRFEIPQLTSDSSVRSLNLSIPGQRVVREKPQFGLTVVLPPGQDPSYVRARCVDSGFPWTADFTLGSRDNGGNPTGPPEYVVSDSGTAPCTGVLARARIGSVNVIGPNRLKRNRPRVYRVRIRNAGTAAATGVRLRVAGRGIRANVFVGRINPRTTRAVRVRVRPRAVGRIRTVFRATSNNAGNRAAVRFIRVVR